MKKVILTVFLLLFGCTDTSLDEINDSKSKDLKDELQITLVMDDTYSYESFININININIELTNIEKTNSKLRFRIHEFYFNRGKEGYYSHIFDDYSEQEYPFECDLGDKPTKCFIELSEYINSFAPLPIGEYEVFVNIEIEDEEPFMILASRKFIISDN